MASEKIRIRQLTKNMVILNERIKDTSSRSVRKLAAEVGIGHVSTANIFGVISVYF